MKIALLFLTLMLSNFCFAQEADLCTNPDTNWTTHVINYCQSQQLEVEEQKLEEAYQNLMSTVQRRFDWLTTEATDRNQVELSLQKSQQAWIKYREEHCQYYRGLASRGTASGSYYLSCKTTLTKARIDLLLKDLEDLSR